MSELTQEIIQPKIEIESVYLQDLVNANANEIKKEIASSSNEIECASKPKKRTPIAVSVNEKRQGQIQFFHNPKIPRVKAPPKKKATPQATPVIEDGEQPAKKPKRKRVKKQAEPISRADVDLNDKPAKENEDLVLDKGSIELIDFINIENDDTTHYNHNTTMDLLAVAIDEIALEGLDGITIEALWKRMSVSLHHPIPFSNQIETFIWEGLRSLMDIEFYKLPKSRSDLVIFDRFQFSDPETGYVIDYVDAPPDIYPYVGIHDKEKDILGSCSTYYTRREISDRVRNLNLAEAKNIYGNHLVLVANQRLRNRALMPELTNPMIVLCEQQYCILERIGRGRYLGEITCGTQSLQLISKDSKTLFYFRKILIKHNLICKQTYCFKNSLKQNMMGILFHLSRFYNERKTRKQLMIEQVIKLLKTRPKYRMEYIELRTILGVQTWDKLSMVKLIKSQEFRNLVKTDIMLDYREVYPKAAISEWRTKAHKEKRIRVLELRNPHINVNSLWKDEEQKESSSDEEVMGELVLNEPIVKQCFDAVFESGRTGRSLKEIQIYLGTDFYTIRGILKKLISQDLVKTNMFDEGRQRFARYICTCFNDDEFHQEFLAAKDLPRNNEYPCDDATLDFISNILEIDMKDLKPTVDVIAPEIISEYDQFKGRYDELKQLRTVKKKSKDNDNKIALQDIYSNNHGFFDYNLDANEIVVTHNKIEEIKNEDFKQICTQLINPEKNTIKSTLVSTKINKNEIRRRFELLENKLNKVVVVAKIRKFVPVLKILYNKQPNFLAKSHKTYYQKVKSLLDSLQGDKQPMDLIVSDDEVIEDSNSLWINLDEDEELEKTQEIDLEVKELIIKNFEKPDLILLEELSDLRIKDLIQESVVPNEEEHKRLLSIDEEEVDNKIIVEEVVIEEVKPIEETLDTFGARMEIFMGPKPILLTHTMDDDGVEMKLIVSTDPKNFPKKANRKVYSERVKFRTKYIREAVEKNKLVTNPSKLMQLLNETERRSGYNVVVDRKSIDRIYATLAEAGHITVVKILVRYETIVRSKNMIVCPKVDLHTIIASGIDQFKMSFFIYAKRKMAPKIEATPQKTDLVDDSKIIDAIGKEEQTSEIVTSNNVRYKYSRTVGRVYGFYPKIAKMRVLHELLQYLVHDYTGATIPIENAPEILNRYCDTADDTLLNECSTFYKDEISWKTFIPPLPQHKGWPNGWLLICDVLLRLPLSIFVKIFNVTYIIPELSKIFLNHPVRKHFLIKNLPADTRDAILSYRKYIYSVHEVFCHLCYLGLIQFGPQKLREKDQCFVFVNKHAILYDTTSSAPGYHQIVKKEYPKMTYTFESQTMLDKYWGDLYHVSMSTKLGQRASVLGKYISLENIHSKQIMLQAMKPQTPESALENDVGFMPGDGLGACCTDSAMWMHIKRNWIWSTQATKANKPSSTLNLTGVRKKHIQDLKPIKFSDYLKQNEKKPEKNETPNTSANIRKQAKKKKVPVSMIQQRKAILRKVKPRKCLSKRDRVDAIDKTIIARMGKSRAVFGAEEDKVIQLCKSVIDYLCPNQRKRTVVYSAIRDFIHRILPYSRKTSTAYKRRLCQLKKSHNLQDKKQPIEFNLSSNYFTQKHFKKIRSKIRISANHISELEVSLSFLYLAYYTFKSWKNSPQDLAAPTDGYTDYLSDTYINRLKQCDYAKDEEDENIYQDPLIEEDVSLDTIKSVIHSSLGCQNASQEWPYKLLKVYQSFSEDLLRTALNLLRDQQLISGKKTSTKHSGGREGSILMGGTSYHLSFGYTFKQITKYPSYIFSEALDYFLAIYKYLDDVKTTGKNIDKFEQGHGIALSEIATIRKFSFRFELPDDVISLDPNIEDRTELITELALRYKLLMSRKSQEDIDETNFSEKDEDNTKLEKILENFIKAHFSVDEIEKNGLENEINNDLKLIFGSSGIAKDLDLNETNTSDATKSSTSDLSLNELSSSYLKDSSTSLSGLTVFSKSMHNSDENEIIRIDRRFRSLRVSDLAFLLTKGLFPELDDDERLEKLNKHFLVRYPSCTFVLKDDKFFKNDDLYQVYTDVITISKNIHEQLEKDCIVPNSIPDGAFNIILEELGGNAFDANLAEDLLNFVHLKKNLGATPKELKDNYVKHKGNLSLDQIIRSLIDIGLILRAGICNIQFIHFNFRHHWTIYLDSSKNPRLEKDTVGYRVKITPWIRIDGSIHTSILDNWLSIILSHCLSFTYIPLTNLFKRFCYIKPVDIYSIVELLQQLKCIRIMAYEDTPEADLFSEVSYVEKVPAQIFDNFNNIFIETDNLATIKFGAYLNKDNTDFNIPFEE